MGNATLSTANVSPKGSYLATPGHEASRTTPPAVEVAASTQDAEASSSRAVQPSRITAPTTSFENSTDR